MTYYYAAVIAFVAFAWIGWGFVTALCVLGVGCVLLGIVEACHG